MSIDRCQIRSIGRITGGEATASTGTCTRTAGGSDVESATGGESATGSEGAAAEGVGVVLGVGEVPLGEDDPLREDHGSRNRLADLDRS